LRTLFLTGGALALAALSIAGALASAGSLMRFARGRNGAAVGRSIRSHVARLTWLRLRGQLALRLRGGATPRDQTTRTAAQPASRTLLIARFRGVRLTIAARLRILGNGCLFTARCFCGMPGCGQFCVVGICQNNLDVR
jgi:hypothetical protein